MHRKIGTLVVALVLFATLSAVSFAQTRNSGGVNSTAEGIGSTSSTHNPRPSSPGPTGMEKGKATGAKWVLILQHTIHRKIPQHTIHPKNVEALIAWRLVEL